MQNANAQIEKEDSVINFNGEGLNYLKFADDVVLILRHIDKARTMLLGVEK